MRFLQWMCHISVFVGTVETYTTGRLGLAAFLQGGMSQQEQSERLEVYSPATERTATGVCGFNSRYMRVRHKVTHIENYP